MDIWMMKERSRILTKAREFFLERDYLETDTPILSPDLIPESCLEAFETAFDDPFRGKRALWLVPSPEIWMKKVIAETRRSVFQVAKCFRNCESIGRIHNPEFTMLEYYTVGADAEGSISITEDLFRACAPDDAEDEVMPPFARISMRDACLEFTGLDLEGLQDEGELIEAARGLGLMVSEGGSWGDVFNQVFLSFVEPELPSVKPLVLFDFPRKIDCLAKNIPDRPWKERWELYVKGIELANCYTEIDDYETVKQYLKKEGEAKLSARVPHMIDPHFADLFHDFPPCSGAAIGFDRLVMAMTGKMDIREAMLFPFGKILG
jgi:elongation factor P--(R)-beta-lysine ligase